MSAAMLSQEARGRLADSSTYAAMDAAQAAGMALFGPCMTIVWADLSGLILIQSERRLTAVETAQVVALRASFDVLANERKRFVAVDLKRRLEPWSRAKMASA